jgi:hypothetical protein
MDANRHIWHIWATNLHRWGLQDLTATVLEVAGPLSIVGAQLIYLGQPILNSFLPVEHVYALADMLDDTTQTRAFASFLREGTLV